MLDKMICILRKDSQKKFQLTLGHRLDYKPVIVREKEKAAASTRSFTCLENLVAVQNGTQRFLINLS
jgi:hypothetical protein